MLHYITTRSVMNKHLELDAHIYTNARRSRQKYGSVMSKTPWTFWWRHKGTQAETDTSYSTWYSLSCLFHIRIVEEIHLENQGGPSYVWQKGQQGTGFLLFSGGRASCSCKDTRQACTPFLQGAQRLSLALTLGRSPRVQLRGCIWQLGISPTEGLCPR